MFKASKHGMNPPDYHGICKETFNFWTQTFDNVLADIANEYTPDQFLATEKWFK